MLTVKQQTDIKLRKMPHFLKNASESCLILHIKETGIKNIIEEAGILIIPAGISRYWTGNIFWKIPPEWN